MRFVGRGHAAIRATHHKTLELGIDEDITQRATCVIAVGTEPQPVAALAGPVRIRISVGRERFSLDAVANPAWDPSGPVIVRRTPLRLPGTFATDATAVAADLPRELVLAMQDPDALVTVDVAPRPDETPTVVLFAADPTAHRQDSALVAELDRADVVIAEDADARRLAGPSRSGDGGRTLVVATRELPGRTCWEQLWAAGAVVDTIGLPAPLAVAAACPSRGPLTFGADPEVLRSVPSTHRLVLPVRRRDLPVLLQRAAELRGNGSATVVQEFGRPQLASPTAMPDFPSEDDLFCCLHPAPTGEAVDPAVRAVIDGLLADGVPTKTAARALATLTGWERRRAYAAVVGWTD